MPVDKSEHEALFDEIMRGFDGEALFNDIMRDFETNQRRGRDEGILEQISNATRELCAENDRREAIIAAQRAENDRSEWLARERRAEEERRASEMRRRKIEAAREARACILGELRRKLDSIVDPKVLSGLHVDMDVVFSANPDDDSLPLNFNTQSPEYRAWKRSPAYGEFWERVKSGEEDTLSDSVEF